MKGMMLLDDIMRAHVERSAKRPFFAALDEGTLPIDSYAGLLRAMTIVEAAVEQMAAMGGSDVNLVTPISRSTLIARDLERLSGQQLRDTPGAILRAALLAQDLQPSPGDEKRFATALQFAIAVSALGQPSLRILVEQRFVADADQPADYLASLGEARKQAWQQVIGEASESAEMVLVEGVRQMLHGIEELLQTLYPLSSERLRDLVAGLNREAGTHAISDDLREVRAALRAGEVSLGQFPYYTERYGERGRRFTHSDSAWLVTLTELTEPLVDQQIGWLGRVLASRGMPRWLLALHLEILGNELAQTIPERAHEYEKLHHAAASIHRRRRDFIDDDGLTVLERDFDVRVGLEWQRRLPRTGALLGAAVADEADGIKRAVESVESWLVDPALFPPQWIAAVRTTLDEARRVVRTPSSG